jgi:hypothetical protein
MVTWLAKQQLKKQKSSCEDYEVEKIVVKRIQFSPLHGDEFLLENLTVKLNRFIQYI